MDAQLKGLLKTLDQNYAKLPSLPKGGVELIVNFAPWLALIFGVLAVLTGVAAFGFLSVLSPFAMVAGAGSYAVLGMVYGVLLLAQGVLELLAFPSLKARKVRGWNLMFYSLVLGLVGSIFTLSVSSIVGGVLGVLIGYYFLYQVKSYYK